MNRIELHLLYKSETGNSRIDEVKEFDVYRSKGKWIINASDEEMIDILTLPVPDPDYLEWVENKLINLLKIN